MDDDKRDAAARRVEEAASAVLRADKKAVDRELAKEPESRERRRKREGGKPGRTRIA